MRLYCSVCAVLGRAEEVKKGGSEHLLLPGKVRGRRQSFKRREIAGWEHVHVNENVCKTKFHVCFLMVI